MRCVVKGCKNDSRRKTKARCGITFHVFPTDPSLRTTWLQVLGKDRWIPKERSTVCSDHFFAEDLYETHSGLRKVRTGAVPSIMTQEDFDSLNANLKVCRICLETESKLYPIRKYNMDKEYELLTGLSLSDDDRLPQMLCVLCAKRLSNCSQLRNISLRANMLMLKIVNQSNFTVNSVKSLQSENHDLTSGLVSAHFEPNHCDIEINENEKTSKSIIVSGKDESVFLPLNLNEDMDSELEAVVLNNDIENEKDCNNYKENIENDVTDTNIKEEFDIDIDDTNIDDKISDIDEEGKVIDEEANIEEGSIKDLDNDEFLDSNYSTDDSLPLTLTRCKKEKKTKKTIKKVRQKIQKQNANEPKIDRRRKPFLTDDLNESLFKITDLTLEEQLAEIENRQYTSNYTNSNFKCNECYKGFLDERAFNSHMARHTTACGEFRCKICKTHFKFSRAMRKHVTAHHAQKFTCNLCPYVTSHRQTARLHERWHKGTQYKCPHCAEIFDKFTTYMGHIRIKHPSDFVCQLCGYSFVSEKGISLHKRLKHRLETATVPEDGPLCDLCNIRFVSHEALKSHMRVSARHNNPEKETQEPNKPGYRGRKSAKEAESKRDHITMPTSYYRKPDGPIPCEQCGLQLESSRAYHSHFRRMHPDKNRTQYPSMRAPCMCEVCGRMFQSQALLKDHRWLHTNECPFKCESCGKTFRMKQRLVAHRHVHSSQKAVYDCQLCGKHFSSQSNRQRHMFIHTGLRPFKCEMCGKGFKHISEKRSHIAYVHLKKPWPKRSRGKRRTDGRQGSLSGQQMAETSDIEMQPIWSSDPKIVIVDKPYYKI